jgi:hypothetical protein
MSRTDFDVFLFGTAIFQHSQKNKASPQHLKRRVPPFLGKIPQNASEKRELAQRPATGMVNVLV